MPSLETDGARRSARILNVGFICVEHTMFTTRLPAWGECFPANSYATNPGGKAANTSIATHRGSRLAPTGKNPNGACAHEDVDISVAMIGAVGNDPAGRDVLDQLSFNGVDISRFCTMSTEPTGQVMCIIDETTRENRLLFYVGASGLLSAADFSSVESLGSPKPDLVISQLELRPATVEQLVRTSAAAGVDVLLNAAPAPATPLSYYDLLTHLVVNETEAAGLTDRAVEDVNKDTWAGIARELLDRGVQNVVLTLGARGAYYANRNASGLVPGYRVKVLDTTGAGDAFVGAYAAEYVQQKKQHTKWDIELAVTRACKAGALSCTGVGAQGAIPWYDEIEAFDAERCTS